MKNVFYFRYINSIGGIEQFFAYLSEKYKDWDITVYYKTGDAQQIARLKKFIRVEKFTEQIIECDKAFLCFNTEVYDYLKCDDISLVLHGDYKTMALQGMLDLNADIFKREFTHYYGVSKVVCDAWTEMTGKPCTLVYNPFIEQPKKNILKLVYCGRLTPEKGGDVVDKLLTKLDEMNIDYQFYLYSNKNPFDMDKHNIIYLNTRLDAGQFLNPHNFDFIIVPSKNEGYCYSLVQALSNGLPAIVTPCPVFKEIGVNKSNSIEIAFNGSNVEDVINQILTREFKFKYTPKEDTWNEILAAGETTYKYKTVKIRALEKYFDGELSLHIKVGDITETTEERANQIIKLGLAELIEEEK